jgi:excisionase family DNA binding protein
MGYHGVMDDDWMTVAEAAEYLDVNRNTLYRWCEQGRLRHYELESGGGRRFRKDDLDRLLRPSGECWTVWVRLQGVPNAAIAQPHGSLGPDHFTDSDVEQLRARLAYTLSPGGYKPTDPALLGASLKNGEIEAIFHAEFAVSDGALATICARALMPRCPGRLVRLDAKKGRVEVVYRP